MRHYQSPGPTREEIDATRGPLLLEFGTDWCGHCQRAAPAVETALNELPPVPHLQIEDDPGRRLGRSFRVKLWPTLIALQDGQELARVVRPTTPAELRPPLPSSTNSAHQTNQTAKIAKAAKLKPRSRGALANLAPVAVQSSSSYRCLVVVNSRPAKNNH